MQNVHMCACLCTIRWLSGNYVLVWGNSPWLYVVSLKTIRPLLGLGSNSCWNTWVGTTHNTGQTLAAFSFQCDYMYSSYVSGTFCILLLYSSYVSGTCGSLQGKLLIQRMIIACSKCSTVKWNTTKTKYMSSHILLVCGIPIGSYVMVTTVLSDYQYVRYYQYVVSTYLWYYVLCVTLSLCSL